MSKQKVLIVGGGFAGVKTALELADYPAFAVTLISDKPNFRYHPTLYRTATGGGAAQSSIPLLRIFGGKAVEIIIGSAERLDREKRRIIMSDGASFEYDILVLALGVVTNYFGIKGLPEYSYGIKSLEEAEEFKAHLHQQLADQHKPDLNYIIIGGGPTGIELAGALPAYLHHVIANHHTPRKRTRIDLVEAAPQLIPRLPAPVGRAVAKRLRQLGVHLYMGQTVRGETANNLMMGGEQLPSHTVVWTAGVTNHPFFKVNGFALTDKGKVVVDKYLQAEPNVYVLGDNADTLYSGMAQTALHNAKFLANRLKYQAAGRPLSPYQPKRPVYVIPVGPGWAAVCWGRFRFYGRIGWWLREAAEAIARHDLAPWRQAVAEWLTEFQTEDNCPTCAKAQLH